MRRWTALFSAFLGLPLAVTAHAQVGCIATKVTYEKSTNLCVSGTPEEGVSGEYSVVLRMSCRDVMGCMLHGSAVLTYDCSGGPPVSVESENLHRSLDYSNAADQDIRECPSLRRTILSEEQLDQDDLEISKQMQALFVRLEPKLKAIAHPTPLAWSIEEFLTHIQTTEVTTNDATLYSNITDEEARVPDSASEDTPYGVMTERLSEFGSEYEITEYLMGQSPASISHQLWLDGKLRPVRAKPGVELPPLGWRSRISSQLIAGIRISSATPLNDTEVEARMQTLLSPLRDYLQKRLMLLAPMTSCQNGRLSTPFRVTFSYVPAPGADMRSKIYELGCAKDEEDFAQVPPLSLIPITR